MYVFCYTAVCGISVWCVFFFFFKQKTAYEMRISDWSSDVCSSDLVVELDLALPFTAARARNAGLEAILGAWPDLEYVQFVDGDCELEPGWLAAAEAFLRSEPAVAAVCGRRR